MKSAKLILWFGIIITLCVWTFLLSSCTLTISPDGSKSVMIDGPSLIQILADK